MSTMPQRITEYDRAEDAVADICRGFCAHDAGCLRCSEISHGDVPEPFRRLLVHNEHMTRTLERHYGRPVELRVLEQELDDDLYRRKILLTLLGTQTVVELGVVRIDLSYTPEPVRSAILERRTPLGDLLIQHEVLRRIDPRWYLRIDRGCALVGDIGIGGRHPMYGRVGTIYCDHRPAIELLEIVTGVPVSQ